MTLVEFLAPLAKAAHRDRVLATLFFAREHESEPVLTVRGIRERLILARVKGAKRVNVADVLAKASPYVAQAGMVERGAHQWALTDSGVRYVRRLLDLPDHGVDMVYEAGSLESLPLRITDEIVRGYVEEAVLCLSAGALRSSVVFLWAGAIRSLQEQALQRNPWKRVTAAVQKHDPKARRVTRVDDFSNIKDSIALLAFRELGILDKGEWQTLNDALSLRNRCGHPTKYRPGVKKVSAFIEDAASCSCDSKPAGPS